MRLIPVFPVNGKANRRLPEGMEATGESSPLNNQIIQNRKISLLIEAMRHVIIRTCKGGVLNEIQHSRSKYSGDGCDA